MALYGAPSRHFLKRTETLDGDYDFTRMVSVSGSAVFSGTVDLSDADVTLSSTSPVQLPTYTVATVPAAGDHEGAMIYVSDGDTGDPAVAVSDGADWLVLFGLDGGTPISDGT